MSNTENSFVRGNRNSVTPRRAMSESASVPSISESVSVDIDDDEMSTGDLEAVNALAAPVGNATVSENSVEPYLGKGSQQPTVSVPRTSVHGQSSEDQFIPITSQPLTSGFMSSARSVAGPFSSSSLVLTNQRSTAGTIDVPVVSYL